MIDELFKLLAAVGFNEPLHPPITHMPIGLVFGAAVFLAIAIFFKKKEFILTARHVSILAFVFAFPTILLGVIDWIHFYHAAMVTPIKVKIVLASIVLIVLGAGIIIGSEIKIRSWTMAILATIALVCVIGLGYFGAGIIYGRGMGQKAELPSAPATPRITLIQATGSGDIGLDEKLGEKVPLDIPLITETGSTILLKDALKGPTILTFVYYKCPNECSLLLAGLAESLRALTDRPGTVPNIITMSVAPDENIADVLKTRTIALATIQKPYPPDKWRFLRGNRESIRRLTDAVGFRFVKKGGDYDHPLCLIILSPEGKVSRYIMGSEFLPADLSISLLQASGGVVKPTVARALRFCFTVDPSSHKLVFNLLRVSATVIITFVGLFALYLVLSMRKRKTEGAKR
jgi:protein SCO1/2